MPLVDARRGDDGRRARARAFGTVAPCASGVFALGVPPLAQRVGVHIGGRAFLARAIPLVGAPRASSGLAPVGSARSLDRRHLRARPRGPRPAPRPRRRPSLADGPRRRARSRAPRGVRTPVPRPGGVRRDPRRRQTHDRVRQDTNHPLQSVHAMRPRAILRTRGPTRQPQIRARRARQARPGRRRRRRRTRDAASAFQSLPLFAPRGARGDYRPARGGRRTRAARSPSPVRRDARGGRGLRG